MNDFALGQCCGSVVEESKERRVLLVLGYLDSWMGIRKTTNQTMHLLD